MTTPVDANHQLCGPEAEIRRTLTERHKERLVIRGIIDGNAVFELWMNADGTTWTAVLLYASKLMCAMTAGEDLEFLPRPPAAET